MSTLEVVVTRSASVDKHTPGRMTINGRHFGYTCEDLDRHLEDGGVKVPKETAIPRGRYRLSITFSPHFGKMLPLIENVPGFSGVRIHGGNTEADTEGCILLGKAPTPTGIANCAERMSCLCGLLTEAEDYGTECWITVE